MLDDVLSLLRDHQRFVLTTHVSPDGDAIGSQLAMGRFLEKMGKQATLLNNDGLPRTLEWLPGADHVQVFDGSFAQRKALAEADVFIVLDTNAAHRLGDELGASVRKSAAPKVLIDHHTNPERWFDATYQRDTSAATGELVYELIAAHDPSLIDADLATALYTAIMTDTGSFRFNSVTPAIHHIIADILERGGIQPAPIHRALYDNRRFAAVRLLGLAINRIQHRYDGRVAYTFVTNDMLRGVGADTEDKEGIVSYVLSIEGVEAALIFSEATGGTKISFRSEGETHVNKWAAAFGGGGHRNASGAYVEQPLDETIEAVLDAAPDFIDVEMPQTNGSLSDEDMALLSALKKKHVQNG